MKLNDWGKLAVILTINVCSTQLAAAKIMPGNVAVVILLVSLGYVTGNGVLARRREAPSTVLAPKMPDPRRLELSANSTELAALLAEFEDRLLEQLGASRDTAGTHDR